MRTRTRTDSTAGQRLDFSWDNDAPVAERQPQFPAEDEPSMVPADATAATENDDSREAPAVPLSETPSPTQNYSNSETKPESPQPETEDVSTSAPDEPDEPAAPEPDMPEPPAEQPQPAEDAIQPTDKRQRPRFVKSTQNTSIVKEDIPLGVRLRKIRENANVSVEDLSIRLHVQSSTIVDLENGDYDSLCRSYNQSNGIYLVATLKDICRELGVSKNEMDELEDIFYREISKAAHNPYSGRQIQIQDRTEESEGSKNISVSHADPIIKKLPKILVFLLVLSLALFIFISVVIPYIRNSRKEPERKLDFAPLVVPEKTAPMVLPIPR